jgi:metal transporter CNNM
MDLPRHSCSFGSSRRSFCRFNNCVSFHSNSHTISSSNTSFRLMGQDEVYLQVLAASGDARERHHAQKVLNLLKKGKHWVLVTLLLGNVITNETLPIMLDRSLGGGMQAVLGSTVLIVIFGEVLPQSVCVRYGLPIGSFMTPFVVFLMWILAPVAWPTAKLLDYLLGQDHGTTYKKAGLKTLVTLHRTLGTSPEERLNRDEVTIISAVLDLKEKPVGSIMTPMEDVFTLSADTILDDDMMNTILSEGYSRIPIYAINDPENFIGMLLVKMLITYDPEDCLRVDDFNLATLPETRSETSCLDIVNFFQEGKSHMVLISEFPGEPHGALGVLTLEDVIEELIGEEIIDESDVFIDVHKAIRRINPISYFRVPKEHRQQSSDEPSNKSIRRISDVGSRSKQPKLKRRRSSGGTESLPMQRDDDNIRNHLKHLGPSNLASKPKSTRINTVKIKPGLIIPAATVPLRRALTEEPTATVRSRNPSQASFQDRPVSSDYSPAQKAAEIQQAAIETTGLLSAGYPASDGVHAVGYGALSTSPTQKSEFLQPVPQSPVVNAPTSPSPLRRSLNVDASPASETEQAQLNTTTEQPSKPSNKPPAHQEEDLIDLAKPTRSSPSQTHLSSRVGSLPQKYVVTSQQSRSDASDEEEATKPDEESSGQTMKSSISARGAYAGLSSGNLTELKASAARSGSIFEREADVGGVRKVVLDIKEGEEDEHEDDEAGSGDELLIKTNGAGSSSAAAGGAAAKDKKKRRKKKRRKTGGKGEGDGKSEEGGVSLK